MGDGDKKGLSIEVGFKPSAHYVLHSCNSPPLYKGKGLNFQNFPKKGRSDFSHKKEGVGKIEGLF